MHKKKYKTMAIAKADVFTPNEKARSESAKAMSQTEYPHQQDDLLYVRSVLVTAGINSNDDVFLVKELWNARRTPVLKPLDWMHNDQEIVGVMYNAEARDLSTGETINLDKVLHEEPFEIATEGVVYKFLFPERAQEVIDKAKAGELYVSMECWFDDYDYVVFNDGEIEDIIRRTGDTAFMDSYLKAFGGTGHYPDDDGKKVGRGLRNIVFGGCGFVYCPANNRSIIEKVGSDSLGVNERIIQLIDVLENNHDLAYAINKEVKPMKEDTVVKDTIEKVLDERDQKQKSTAELEELKEQAALAADLQTQKNDLEARVNLANDEKTAMLSAFTDAVDEIVKIVAEVPGVSKLEAEDDDNDAFQAKLSWLKETTHTVAGVAVSAKEMQERLDEIKAVARVDEIKELMGDILEDETITRFSENAKAMSDEEYEKWIGEKKELLASVSKVNDEQKPESEKAESTEKEEESAEEKEVEETEEKADAEEKSDVDKLLDTVEVEKEPDLSQASNGEEDVSPLESGMKAVASIVTSNSVDDDKDEGEKPGFDPVG